MGPATERPGAFGGGAPYLIIALVYLALVFGLSHVPGQLLDFKLLVWDKLVHFAEYVPLGFLLAGWVVRRPWAPRARTAVVIAVTLATLLLGAADEFHQWFVPNRSATVGDALADGLGGLVGAIVGVVVLEPRKKRDAATPSGSRTT